MRRGLGRVFGWDANRGDLAERSYVARLTDADRTRSLDEPGSPNGPLRVVYRFEREAVGEVINATVHAFVVFAMEPVPNGYRLFWAVYVKNVNWFTPLYMALINPLRRFLVYPSLIKQVERAWSTSYTV